MCFCLTTLRERVWKTSKCKQINQITIFPVATKYTENGTEAVKYEISLCKWVFAQSFGSENAIASEKFVQNKKIFDAELLCFL